LQLAHATEWMCSSSRATPPMSKTTAIGSIFVRRRLQASAQLGGAGRGVAGDSQASASERPSGSDAVEGEAEELGEARLAGAVEARDPGAGQLGAAGLVEFGGDVGEQADVLLVDAAGHAAVVGVTLGPAAGDDVLADLGGDFGRGLLVEVDDRAGCRG
jgi:hypothetical protein